MNKHQNQNREVYVFPYVDGMNTCNIPIELIPEQNQIVCFNFDDPVKFHFGGVDGIGGLQTKL